MKPNLFMIILIAILLLGCSAQHNSTPTSPDPFINKQFQMTPNGPSFVSWGSCDMTIARDGSDWDVIPTRSSDSTWGFHLNAVKLLEDSPGQHCIQIVGATALPNGDLSVDIAITHPWDNPVYTGFDVRGIVLFPSSQYIQDNELLVLSGNEPQDFWSDRFSSYRKGDAELMNPDGYTTIWAPDELGDQKHKYELEEGFPIFEYFPGEMASGDDLGTINGFKRYYSNQNRHMFEAGKTVTRTYVIRPPEIGPIQASYSVYAHWAEPNVIPVLDPASDFGPEANSPMPYEFWIEQLAPLDFDAPVSENGMDVLWHVKSWNFGLDDWDVMQRFLIGGTTGGAEINFIERFDQCPDCYCRTGAG